MTTRLSNIIIPWENLLFPASFLVEAYRSHESAPAGRPGQAAIIRKIIGDKPLEKISLDDFAALDRGLWRMAKPRSEATINHYCKTLKALFNYAIRRKKFIGENPVKEVRPYVVDERRRAYSEEEMKRILDAAAAIAREAKPNSGMQAQAYRFVLLLYLTGMRAGEVTNLRWDNVGPDAIRLRRSETKQRRNKIVPITAEIQAVLDELAGMRKNEYVLPFRRRGQGPIPPSWIHPVMCKIRGRSGIKDFIFHNLRHTASTIMVAQAIGRGANLADIMSVLGHSRTETTLRHTHSSLERMKIALETIPKTGYNMGSTKNASPRSGAAPGEDEPTETN